MHYYLFILLIYLLKNNCCCKLLLNSNENSAIKVNVIIINTMERFYMHDVTVSILVSQNNETAAMLVFQTSPLGLKLFSCVNAFLCAN